MDEKPRKKWSTLKDEESGIVVAGRQMVERTIVSISDYQMERMGYTADEARFRVTISLSIGDADEGAVSKAFTALGRHVARDAMRRAA